MAITQAVANSFKLELAKGLHDFTPSTGHTFKIALYTESATLDSSTTIYSATNEVSSANYTAGGKDLTVLACEISSGTLIIDFQDTSWANVTFTARGALIYNSTVDNRAVAVFNFGSNIGVSSGNFILTFPSATSSTATIRIA